MKGNNKERTMGYMHGNQTKGTTCCPAARKGMRRRLNKIVRQHEQRLLLAETRAILDAEHQWQAP